MTKKESGYIALISAIVISSLLLIITFTANFSSFFARFNILDSEYKKVSTGLAEACAETAILEIAKNPAWSPDVNGTCVGVGDPCPGGPKVCKICSSINAGGNDFEIKTRASYGNPDKAYTNLVVNVTRSATDVRVNSWEEVGTYLGPDCPLP